MRRGVYVVERDGRPVSDEYATHAEAFGWLLDHQGQSVQHATTFEGYEIVERLDGTDRQLIVERVAALEAESGPRCGDYVDFPNGVIRRISHDWGDEVQTSTAGSWYLGDGYISFSGGLYGVTSKADLVSTGGLRDGSVWIFHHDYHTAHNGVDTQVPLRVFASTSGAPS